MLRRYLVSSIEYLRESKKIVFVSVLFMLIFSSTIFLLAGEKYFHYFFSNGDTQFFVSKKYFEEEKTSGKIFGISIENNFLREFIGIAANNLQVNMLDVVFYPTLIHPVIDLIRHSFVLGFLMKFCVTHFYRNSSSWVVKVFGLTEGFFEILVHAVFLGVIMRAGLSLWFEYRETGRERWIKRVLKHYVYLVKVWVLFTPLVILLALWEALGIVKL